MQELAEAWRTRLLRDLIGFADRGIAPVVERSENTLKADWTTRGKTLSELFGIGPDGTLRWVSGPSGDDSYETFLRSDGMADFKQLADAIARAISRRAEFVASDAVVDFGFEDSETVKATPERFAEVADQVRLLAEGRTNLFFVKGDPGAGKTTLLREATALQAMRYSRGDSSFLFFFVSAQGRELSNLRDAFSGELQDLRAGFTRDAIAALARAGLLIPIVDGFDELLGTAGYGGAFSSLQSLLVDLEGLGALVVSARSAFYDLEFLGRSTSPANQADIRITTIGLKPWTDSQLSQYLGFGDAAELSKALSSLTDADRQLLRKPFFASEFPGFAQQRPETNSDGALLEYLIGAYIEREAEKIVDSTGDPVLPVDGHRRLFELAASEMWETEARQLSGDDLRTLTEMIAEELELGPDEAAQLTTKVTSYAGFRTGLSGNRDEFVFEHEVYFDYFLARTVRRLLLDSSPEDLQRFLDRGVLPQTVASEAIKTFSGDGTRPDDGLLKSPSGLRHENRRRNLGTLVASYARNRLLERVSASNLSFVDISLQNTHFRNVRFDRCTFYGADLSGTRFEDCEAPTSTFHALVVDNSSRLDIRGLRPGRNVGNIRHQATGDLYAPDDVREVLVRLGAPAEEESAEQPRYSREAAVLIRLLHRAARAYRRTNLLYESDDKLRQLFRNAHWPRLKQLMLEHGVISEEVRSTSGARTPALRLRVTVDQLLIGQAGSNVPEGPSGNLWRALRNE